MPVDHSERREEFEYQALVACRQGASGALVGRAVRAEVADLAGPARQDFLQTVAVECMQRLAAVIEAYGCPWPIFIRGSGWYRT